VSGLSVRDAARRLHAVGLRVEVEGQGTVRGTRPDAGDHAAAGVPVRILAGPGR
jgi:cell division protein FtsI (penicillin-binding protein 3)